MSQESGAVSEMVLFILYTNLVMVVLAVDAVNAVNAVNAADSEWMGALFVGLPFDLVRSDGCLHRCDRQYSSPDCAVASFDGC